MPYRPPLISDPVAKIDVMGTMSAGGSSAVKAGNSFLYRRISGAGVSLAGLITAFQAAVIAVQVLAQSSRYAVNTIRCVDISNPASVGVEVADASVGAIATDSLPSLNTVVMELLTATRGRAGRGRKFFAGVVEASTTDNLLTGAGLVLWQNLRDKLDDVLADGAGNNWAPCVVSKFYSTLTSVPTVIYGDNVSSCKVNKRISRLDVRKTISVF